MLENVAVLYVYVCTERENEDPRQATKVNCVRKERNRRYIN